MARLPARLQRVLESRTAASPRLSTQAEATGRYQSFTIASCGTAAGSAQVEIVILALVDEPIDLSYALTPAAGADSTGPVTIDPEDGFADVTVSGLDQGVSQLRITDPGNGGATTTDRIEVIGCVSLQVSCQALVFTNPADNPAVEVLYGDPDDEDADFRSVVLGPGESARVRTRLVTFDWSAAAQPDGPGTVYSISNAGGQDGITVDQSCTPQVASYAVVSCSTGAPAALDLTIDHAASQTLRYEVTGADGSVVASGAAVDGQTRDTLSSSLPGVGSYRYALYLDGSATAYEVVDFQVLTCVQVTASCRTVTFVNPDANPGVVVSYGFAGGTVSDQLSVAGGTTAKLTWTAAELKYGIVHEPGVAFAEVADQLTERPEISVPQCSTDDGDSDDGDSDDSSSGSSGSGSSTTTLATTGSPAGMLPALIAGLLLTLGGAALLGRRRLRP